MDKDREDSPLLIGQTGPLKGQRWVLTKPILVGRETTCEVVIPDRMVSRFHARISPTSEGVILEDLNSKNGTHRNGLPVTGPVVLEDGDVVSIALAQQFIYVISDATVPLVESAQHPSRLQLDLRSRSVLVNDQPIDPPLSALQFRVLRVLVERQGQVVERQQLVTEAWGDEEAVGVSDQALDALLRRLRDRISAIDPTHNYIVTIRGHGVRLDNPPVEDTVKADRK